MDSIISATKIMKDLRKTCDHSLEGGWCPKCGAVYLYSGERINDGVDGQPQYRSDGPEWDYGSAGRNGDLSAA